MAGIIAIEKRSQQRCTPLGKFLAATFPVGLDRLGPKALTPEEEMSGMQDDWDNENPAKVVTLQNPEGTRALPTFRISSFRARFRSHLDTTRKECRPLPASPDELPERCWYEALGILIAMKSKGCIGYTPALRAYRIHEYDGSETIVPL